MTTIIFKEKYKVENLTEKIRLSESIDVIAYTATIDMVETEELKKLGALKGMHYQPYLDSIGPAYNATAPCINAVMLDFRGVN